MIGIKLTFVLVICCSITLNAINTTYVDDFLKTLNDFYEDIIVRKPRIFLKKFQNKVSAFLYGKSLNLVTFK